MFETILGFFWNNNTFIYSNSCILNTLKGICAKLLHQYELCICVWNSLTVWIIIYKYFFLLRNWSIGRIKKIIKKNKKKTNIDEIFHIHLKFLSFNGKYERINIQTEIKNKTVSSTAMWKITENNWEQKIKAQECNPLYSKHSNGTCIYWFYQSNEIKWKPHHT